MRAQAIQHLETALVEKADVVVFPELTITPAIRREIARWLRVHNSEVAALGRPQLLMAVAGSFHVPAGGAAVYVNEAWALDSQGHMLHELTHRKICPVCIPFAGGLLTEDIAHGTSLSLMKTEGGLHCILICLDLAQQATTRLPLERLPIEWLWVPSMSSKVTPHKERAKVLTLFHPAIVACANQGPASYYPGQLSDEGASRQSFAFSTLASQQPAYRGFAQDGQLSWLIVDFGAPPLPAGLAPAAVSPAVLSSAPPPPAA